MIRIDKDRILSDVVNMASNYVIEKFPSIPSIIEDINRGIEDVNRGINEVSGAISNIGGMLGGLGSGSSNMPGNGPAGGSPSLEGDKEEEDNEKLYLCKYQVQNFVIMLEDEKIETDPSNILSIEYLNDYEFNLMALLKVKIRVDVRKKLWILKNKKDIVVKFELDKIGQDPDQEEFVTSPEEVWNLEFSVFFNDEDEAIDVEIMEERIELNEGEDFQTGDIENESYSETQNSLDLYLFHPELLQASRYSFNRVYTESTLQNIVGEMLTDSGHVHVLMSKFENDEVYKELLLPANPVYKNLIYLDQYFGMYEKGALIYYDIDTLYILNTDGKVTAKREEEWTEVSFRVSALDDSSPGNGMLRVEDEEIYYPMISEMEVNPQKFSIAKNVEFGSEAKIVVTDTVDIDVHEADQSFINERNENITYIRSQNKYTGSVLQARMEENECVLYISAQNLDVSAFRPNKTFRVIFDEQTKQDRYGNNEYRLAYAYHFFKIESEEFMSSSHRIVLKKTDGPEEESEEEESN